MRGFALLRSRRLAAWLLVGLTIFAAATTLVPPGRVAFASPLVLLVAALVATATGACAWERSRSAVRRWSRRFGVSPADLTRLRGDAAARCATPAINLADARVRVAAALGDLHMRVRVTPDVVIGASNSGGMLGSPLFHWAIVGLIVFASAGQLTRHEGYANLLVGDTIAGTQTAALVGGTGLTGLDIAVTRLDRNLVVDRIPRDTAPFVEVSHGGEPLAQQWVYSNMPLRAGGLIIHNDGSGRSLSGSVRIGMEAAQLVRLYYPPGSELASGARFGVSGAAGESTLVVEVTGRTGRRVVVAVVGGGQPTSTVLGVGDTAVLAPGVTFTLDQLGTYVRLKMVNDWSVPWLYAMLVLGCIGSALTVFFPPRTVWVHLPEETADGHAGQGLRFAVSCPKNDPAFPGRVERALRDRFPDAIAGSGEEDS